MQLSIWEHDSSSDLVVSFKGEWETHTAVGRIGREGKEMGQEIMGYESRVCSE